ncbi:PEBP-like protein [Patellaria atrata CBS 101060]|uniref:PEBP-like protein n=1 Tax=Patellaria atrata CBS 101060 TaxID=1346257 RepID=A0A9P4SCK2_9PEZI|nr:PEBP-like protein [Patellaria atrata CBS 101060]
MRLSSLLALAFASVGLAETPPGFVHQVPGRLDVIYGTNVVDPPGERFTKQQTATMPTYGTSDVPLNGTYLIMMIDIDLPANFGGLPAGQRGIVLHGLFRDVKYNGRQSSTGSYILAPGTGTQPSSYFGPSPPAENPPHPHNYIELLFDQPANFAVPASEQQVVNARLPFNYTRFVAAAALQPPIRANYFTVQG